MGGRQKQSRYGGGESEARCAEHQEGPVHGGYRRGRWSLRPALSDERTELPGDQVVRCLGEGDVPASFVFGIYSLFGKD